jgi:hypothetical protein
LQLEQALFAGMAAAHECSAQWMQHLREQNDSIVKANAQLQAKLDAITLQLSLQQQQTSLQQQGVVGMLSKLCQHHGLSPGAWRAGGAFDAVPQAVVRVEHALLDATNAIPETVATASGSRAAAAAVHHDTPAPVTSSAAHGFVAATADRRLTSAQSVAAGQPQVVVQDAERLCAATAPPVTPAFVAPVHVAAGTGLPDFRTMRLVPPTAVHPAVPPIAVVQHRNQVHHLDDSTMLPHKFWREKGALKEALICVGREYAVGLPPYAAVWDQERVQKAEGHKRSFADGKKEVQFYSARRNVYKEIAGWVHSKGLSVKVGWRDACEHLIKFCGDRGLKSVSELQGILKHMRLELAGAGPFADSGFCASLERNEGAITLRADIGGLYAAARKNHDEAKRDKGGKRQRV